MSRFLLLGSPTELGLRFVQAAKSKLQIKCLYISEKPENYFNRHHHIVNSLGGIPVPLHFDWEADTRAGHRVLKPLLKPILDNVDGVVFIRQNPSKRSPRFLYWNDVDNLVLSMLSESTTSPRILAWSKIPGIYRLPQQQEREILPSARTKEFLERVQKAQGGDWTIVRSARWFDDVGQKHFDATKPRPPKGGIAVGAENRSAIWKDDLASLMVEILQTGGLTGRTLDVQSVKPTKDNSDLKKVLAEAAASPKKKLEAPEMARVDMSK
jgi:hypothetical protein